MGFKLKSGNTTSFKLMGGSDKSPAKDMKTGSYNQSFESPAKQRSTKGGEGQDQDKIFDSKGNHIGDYVNDKKVMHKIPNDDNRPRKSPAKQTKDTFAGGSKKSARDKFNDTETAIEQRKADRVDNQKSQYWYKINNKPSTKAQYIAYQNKPGGDEPGKQTNDPDASGNKAKINKNRAKLNK